MKVGIFETEHFESSYPVIKLFDYDNNDITVFTYDEPYRQFQYLFPGEPMRYKWKVKSKTGSKYSFIADMYREIRKQKIDLLCLNTISNNFIFYAILVLLLPKVRVILTIHNINAQFELKRSFNPRRIIRYVGRRILLSSVSEFNVLAVNMVDRLAAKLPKDKKVFCVPGAIFEEAACQQTQPLVQQHINIVIPGSVDGRRRDYQQAFTLIDLLENAKIPSTITFLGSFYGEYGAGILEKSKTLRLSHVRLEHFGPEIIPHPEFDKIMNASTFVFIPSVITTVLEDGVTEIYGTTLSTGNLFDVIRHAKPFIIPEALPVDPFLEKSCFQYQNIEQVARFITTVHNDPATYSILQQHALEASRNYTLQKIRERNASLFIEKKA